MKTRKYLEEIDCKIDRVEVSEHRKAVFVLHDQLNLEAWPDWVREEKPLLIFVESAAKGKSQPYHKKKLIYLLSAMRHFALARFDEGYPVLYHSAKTHYDGALSEILEQSPDLELTMMQASEYDSRERQQKVSDEFGGRVDIIPNNFFLAAVEEFRDNISPSYRMEYFYREMRRKTGYLMNGEKPEGGDWNYDEDNRKKLPRKIKLPNPPVFEPDSITKEVIEMIEDWFGDHFGKSENFRYPVTRKEALEQLNYFVSECLDQFGPYEDAMATNEDVIFHSQLSMLLNNGLLLPGEVCEAALEPYKQGKVRLNSVEGFIRQIIGWREFVRIYYEAMMPDVREANYFEFDRGLPEMYWSGETKMQCMNECLRPVIKDGYSHHIPRLMVLSNFSNLTETDPRELNRWFWLAYVDAYEWVVLPNVLGMSTFADGGVLASKPYVAGGNYINKMSNYCSSCSYNQKEKYGETACPFNYLYWNFIDQQRDTFLENGRANFMVNMFDKKSEEERKGIRESSLKFIEELNRQ